MADPSSGDERILRPGAVLDSRNAIRVTTELNRQDVSKGGAWNVGTSLWQRFDQPWNGPHGQRGDARLVGSIGVMYDSPSRHQITLYRVTITPDGTELGWSVDRLCDDALSWIGLTLANCPRATIAQAPRADPFARARPRTSPPTPFPVPTPSSTGLGCP
jgi:hypothetical protein